MRPLLDVQSHELHSLLIVHTYIGTLWNHSGAKTKSHTVAILMLTCGRRCGNTAIDHYYADAKIYGADNERGAGNVLSGGSSALKGTTGRRDLGNFIGLPILRLFIPISLRTSSLTPSSTP